MKISVTKCFKLNSQSSLLAYCEVQLISDDSVITIDDIQLRKSMNGKGNWLAFYQNKYVDKNGIEQYKAINKVEGNLYYKILGLIQSVYDGNEEVKAKVMVKANNIVNIEYNKDNKESKSEKVDDVAISGDVVSDDDIPF